MHCSEIGLISSDMDIKSHIPVWPDWPTPGVNFLDIGGLMANPTAFAHCIDQLYQRVQIVQPSSLVGIESRGFVFASALALRAGVPLYMARKAGKLPGAVVSHTYDTEYSSDTIQLQQHCDLGTSPMIIDDVLATGGTVLAVARLIRENFNVSAVTAAVVINLEFLHGPQRLQEAHVPLTYLANYAQ